MQRSGGLAWLNIDGSDDPGYRYRMPPAVVRLEQRGKSGHTLLDNCVDVSRALKRPPQYLTKFCGLAVGAMSAFDESQGAAAMRGDFPASMIQAIVFAFVREWCLCKSCGLPETDIEVTKKSVIFDCKACGKRAAADMEHKLASFIFNNPPNAKGTGLVERGKNDANRAEKEERRREREAKRAEQKKREREERRRRRKAEAAEAAARGEAAARAAAEESDDDDDDDDDSDGDGGGGGGGSRDGDDDALAAAWEAQGCAPFWDCARCGFKTRQGAGWDERERLRQQLSDCRRARRQLQQWEALSAWLGPKRDGGDDDDDAAPADAAPPAPAVARLVLSVIGGGGGGDDDEGGGGAGAARAVARAKFFVVAAAAAPPDGVWLRPTASLAAAARGERPSGGGGAAERPSSGAAANGREPHPGTRFCWDCGCDPCGCDSLRVEAEERARAVSYTHLTLPTICSV